MNNSNTPIIRIERATKTYRSGRKHHKKDFHALKEVSLDIKEREVAGIIGYSGAGKSTLVRLINGLEKPTSGTVEVFGQDITHFLETQLRDIRKQIGMIFQQFNLFSSKTVAENVEFPLVQDLWRKDFRDRRVRALLHYVGLAEFADKYPSQLSGGQKQRVGIARALALQPKILLADEATSALDPQTTDEVLELLKRVNQELGITIVMITHQMNVVARIADTVSVMQEGEIVEQGRVFPVFARPHTAITRSFVASAIDTAPTQDVLASLRSTHKGRIITVIMRDASEEDGILDSGTRISAMLTHRNITNNILCGGVKPVAGKSLGAFTYELYGEEAQMDTYIAELAEKNMIVDFGSATEPVEYERALTLSCEREKTRTARTQNV